MPHIEDRFQAEFDSQAGEADLQDDGEFPLPPRNRRSLSRKIIAFRFGVSSSEQLPKAPAEHKDKAGEGGTHDLKRKKTGTGVCVGVCGLCKSAEHSQHLKYDQRSSENSKKYS